MDFIYADQICEESIYSVFLLKGENNLGTFGLTWTREQRVLRQRKRSAVKTVSSFLLVMPPCNIREFLMVVRHGLPTLHVSVFLFSLVTFKRQKVL